VSSAREVEDDRLLGRDTDLEWARSVYNALIEQSTHIDDEHPDALAERVITTLLHGFAPSPAR